MILDFVGCWVFEVVCKYLFANLEPKAMITKGRERREARRKLQEQQKQKQQADAVTEKKIQ
jgi:cation-transporting ATPase 13A1